MLYFTSVIQVEKQEQKFKVILTLFKYIKLKRQQELQQMVR